MVDADLDEGNEDLTDSNRLSGKKKKKKKGKKQKDSLNDSVVSEDNILTKSVDNSISKIE